MFILSECFPEVKDTSLDNYYVPRLGVSPSSVSWWREVYSCWVFEDLKFNISEGYKQN